MCRTTYLLIGMRGLYHVSFLLVAHHRNSFYNFKPASTNTFFTVLQLYVLDCRIHVYYLLY